MLGQLRRRLLGIAPEETTVAKRGFVVNDDRARAQIEKVGQTFVAGYHLAITDPDSETLVASLNEIEPEFQGFAYEGAGMGLALLDMLTPWSSRHLANFLYGPGEAHYYIIQVGTGWALARLKRPVERWLDQLDPIVKWLSLDGYGFHEGFFHWRPYIEQQRLPKRLHGYARRGFDQGLGRSLWFVKGADMEKIAASIAAFAPERQADLWSGVGLACTYAGGVDSQAMQSLTRLAGQHRPYLAQGAVLAVKTRAKAGNLVPHTGLACSIICDLPVAEAVRIFDATKKNLPKDGPDLSEDGPDLSEDGPDPTFEIWRQRIQAYFKPEGEPA